MTQNPPPGLRLVRKKICAKIGAVDVRLVKGSYQITGFVEETPLGQVFHGEILTTKAPLLIKFFKREHLTDAFIESLPKVTPKIENLRHPNILTVYDHHLAPEGLYQICEYPPGKNLAFIVREKGPLPLAETIDIIQQAAAALSYAQENGLLHGALSPERIYLGPKNQIKIGDFTLIDLLNRTNLARANVILTEATYLSPEQIRGQFTTSASDVYSLGLAAYFLLKGQPPFTGETTTAVALAQLKEEPPILTDMQAPAWLAQLVQKSLAKETNLRYKNPLEIIQIIRNNLPPPGMPLTQPARETPGEKGKKSPGRTRENISESGREKVEDFFTSDTLPRRSFDLARAGKRRRSPALLALILFFLAAGGYILIQKFAPAGRKPSEISSPASPEKIIKPVEGSSAESASGATGQPAAQISGEKTETAGEKTDLEQTVELKEAPDLLNLNLAEALKKLENYKGKIILPGITRLSLEGARQFNINKQEPAAGATLPAAIILSIETDNSQSPRKLPSYLGFSAADVRKTLERASFTNVRIIYLRSNEEGRDKVLGQVPAAEQSAFSDDQITLLAGGGHTYTASQLKASRLAMTLPEGHRPWEILIKILDSQGEFTATQALFAPGSRLELAVVGVGQTTAKIYLNGALYKESQL